MNISIAKVKSSDLPECLEVIHQCFKTVAEVFGLTQENCSRHTSFIPLSFLEAQKDWGWHMYTLCVGEKIIGYLEWKGE